MCCCCCCCRAARIKATPRAAIRDRARRRRAQSISFSHGGHVPKCQLIRLVYSRSPPQNEAFDCRERKEQHGDERTKQTKTGWGRAYRREPSRELRIAGVTTRAPPQLASSCRSQPGWLPTRASFPPHEPLDTRGGRSHRRRALTWRRGTRPRPPCGTFVRARAHCRHQRSWPRWRHRRPPAV